jgi:hypothetical protein
LMSCRLADNSLKNVSIALLRVMVAFGQWSMVNGQS